ncbi:uncharacterized protein LOC130967758 [Arachis stenosperma]|uniref:uncharacterized protein LOC130967758 n=1 Tax=Arachis stenosperma TaxID=217475 RepID=UPI0025AC6B52|nr:uncharacterized protein LOC130967758 [Arachis stenosperma]
MMENEVVTTRVEANSHPHHYGGTKSSYDDDDEYNEEIVVGEKPSRLEVWGWYVYELCSYMVQSVVIPVVFPLIISQLQQLSTDDETLRYQWINNHHGMPCPQKQILLYSKLTNRTINITGSHLSSLEWTSIAWGGGLLLAASILGFISFHLDANQFYAIITAAATGVGVFFCLPAGFFKTTKIFIPYIAGIALAATVASTAHTHYLALMLRPYGKPTPALRRRTRFFPRLSISSWYSLYATAFGSLGAAIVSSLTYHMLREPSDRNLLSLWVVSIFSGLIWLAGVVHVVLISPSRSTTTCSVSPLSSRLYHSLSLFKYPHAIGGLFGVFLSSFATMSIFTGGVLFVVGQLCMRPVHLLYLWLVYFLFPLFSLPLLQIMQHFMRVNSVKMQILGFLLSMFSSGSGFYFWESRWRWSHLLLFGAVQGTATGLLHAFGRVLVLNCAPCGKEGAFSAWYGWVRSVGLCVGFTVGSVAAGRIRASLGAAFCSGIAGIVVLLFGNVSDVGGAVAAGHVAEDNSGDISERPSHSHVVASSGLDSKESVSV